MILFSWPCACVFVLCEHMALVLVFCVPCALMSIVLTPPILFPDYRLICPTCVYLVALLICSLYYLLAFAVLCQFVIEFFLFLPCLVLPCQALLPAVLFFPYGVVLVCFVYFLLTIKSPSLCSNESSPHSSTWQNYNFKTKVIKLTAII